MNSIYNRNMSYFDEVSYSQTTIWMDPWDSAEDYEEYKQWAADPWQDPEFVAGYIAWCDEVDMLEADMRGIYK